MPANLTRKTRRAFLLVIFLPLLLGIVVAFELGAYRQSVDWVEHTNLVITTLNQVLLAVTRAESAQRGYLLTSDSNYQTWYVRAGSDARRDCAVLLVQTSDNPAQQKTIRKLNQLVDKRLSLLDALAQRRRMPASNFDEFRSMLASGSGVMRDIWDTARQISTDEQTLLNSRLQTVHNSGLAVGGSFCVCILASVGVLLWAYELIKQYARQKEVAEFETQALNAELEERVALRTAELELTNGELRKSNEDLSKFAYIASHDLQEPLRTVASYVGLLSMRYSGKLDEQADKYIRFAVEGSKRMQSLVNDLLTYSRVGTESLRPAQVDLNKVLGQVRESLDLLLREQNVEISSAVLPTLFVDESRMLQVFSNLIGNAVKFRKSDVPPRIRVEATRQESEWLFMVADNGIGFDQQYGERIFALFQRLHGVGAYPGTGIGLAVCKRIVEQHGGRIWADSTPGEGSRFYFSVPLKPIVKPGYDPGPNERSTMKSEAVV